MAELSNRCLLSNLKDIFLAYYLNEMANIQAGCRKTQPREVGGGRLSSGRKSQGTSLSI